MDRDRLVFDVGHQCYVHKALTGRRKLFGTLRQFECGQRKYVCREIIFSLKIRT